MATLNATPAPLEASETATTTTISPTDALMAGMAVTPGVPSNCLVFFSGNVQHSSNNESIFVSLYVGGVQVPETEHEFKRGTGAANIIGSVVFQKYVVGVGAADAIEVRWRTTDPTASVFTRTLTTWQVP